MCINDFFLGYYCPYFFPNKLKLVHSDGHLSDFGPSSSVQLGISHGDHGYHEFLGSEVAAKEVSYFASNQNNLTDQNISDSSESIPDSDSNNECESLAAAAQIKSLEEKLLAANQKIASLQKSLCVAEKYGNFHDKH